MASKHTTPIEKMLGENLFKITLMINKHESSSMKAIIVKIYHQWQIKEKTIKIDWPDMEQNWSSYLYQAEWLDTDKSFHRKITENLKTKAWWSYLMPV